MATPGPGPGDPYNPSPKLDDSPEEGEILHAQHVYLLMSKEYRISRNRRAAWFFSNINHIISVKKKYKLDEYSDELEIISVIPKDPPHNWTIETSHLFKYLVCSDTVVEVLSRNYRLVYCLDISPSIASVDVQSGVVLFDEIFEALKNSMEGLMKPFCVPGSDFIFRPKLYITIIAHTPFLTSVINQIIVQGIMLDTNSLPHILAMVFNKLNLIECEVAAVTAFINDNASGQKSSTENATRRKENASQADCTSIMSPDFGFVDLLRHALIAVQLLPENSCSELIVITDGVLSVPDGAYLDMVLSQLRYNTVSCSFILLSSPFHPHVSYGVIPYADLLKFIAAASFGAFLTKVPKILTDSPVMNVYHKSFLTWSFQKAIESIRSGLFAVPANRPGEWSVQNKCFTTIRDMPLVKKQQYDTNLSVDYMKILSCRLREGFTIKDVKFDKNSTLEIKLILPWKFLIVIEYILITPWPSQPRVRCIVSLEGPYDFLHDVTCLAKTPFQSYYRQLMVNCFWSSQKYLSESDKLLVHFNSFCSNPSCYNIPDSLKNGLPLFYISSNSSSAALQHSEYATPQFTQFWKPVCLLDPNVWQKWMHTHRIGLLLEHDHPLPRHLQLPNSSGRYQIIQCRQTMMSVTNTLKSWSSFVLVENHSYIKLLFQEEKDKTPNSFCIIRITLKAPCIILRLAFLVGTPGNLRHQHILELKEKIGALTFPPRLIEPPKWRVPSGNSIYSNISRSSKRTWADMQCCILIYKPIEKILIRYEQMPRNFFITLQPQHPFNNWTGNRKSSTNQSTFGFRPTYTTPWGSGHMKMGPEMFNTVARYLHHCRWIWCVQSTPVCSLNMECAARILTTLTKMRLQEGLRFAHSSSGISNMVIELNMKSDKYDDNAVELSGIDDFENYQRSTCILQYVTFPPVTALESLEEEEEGEESDSEASDDDSELYLITECWVEPQYGRIMSSLDNAYLNNLEYTDVPSKIFETDQECISSLVTFEHLSLMCQNESVPSPLEIPEREIKRPKAVIPEEETIKYLPFSCQLNKILPKSRQAEILFSMFNQDLSMSHTKQLNDVATFCDRANLIFFKIWIENLGQLHDRELLLPTDEHSLLYNLIIQRKRTLTTYELPIPMKPEIGNGSIYPKWRCFVKGLTPTHIIITLLPASYEDLKILMLSDETLDKSNINRAVSFIALDSRNDDDSMVLDSDSIVCQKLSILELKNGGRFKEQAFLVNDPGGDRLSRIHGRHRRSRVKSGEETTSCLRKPLSRKGSLDNLFRYKIGVMELSQKNVKLNNQKQFPVNKPVEALESSCSIQSPRTDSDKSESHFSFDTQTQNIFSPNHQPIYGSISLPMYTFDCALSSLTEHIIFRTFSTEEDFHQDFRVPVSDSFFGLQRALLACEEELRNASIKHSSPEPKSDDQELPTCPTEILQNHCSVLKLTFVKSYIHGLFESLQAGHYIHKTDVEEVIRLCSDRKIRIDLSEFIQTICCHCNSGHDDSDLRLSCDHMNNIHGFIKKKFRNTLLSTFHWVMDYSGIFYFKFNSAQMRKGVSLNLFNSFPGTKLKSEVEEMESVTVKANSVKSELINNTKNEFPLTRDGPSCSMPELTPLILGNLDQKQEAFRPDPLFLYLSCTYQRGNVSKSFLTHEIPTCLEEVAEALGDEYTEFQDCTDKMEFFLDFIFLTIPEEIEGSNGLISNLYSIGEDTFNHQPGLIVRHNKEKDCLPTAKIVESNFNEEQPYPPLPMLQHQVVKNVVDDVGWLLEDEITSFRWKLGTVTEHTMELVANHIERSAGKSGCQVHYIPLSFVGGYTKSVGHDKFTQRFKDLRLDGYYLKEEGDWYYLVDEVRESISKLKKEECTTALDLSIQLSKVAAEAGSVKEMVESCTVTPGENKLRGERNNSGKKKSGNVEFAEVEDEVLKNEPVCSNFTTPGQLSEISSVVESVATTEDGYDGDGSDSEDEEKSYMNIRNRTIPPFWMLFKLTEERLGLYFHCRYNEDDIAVFNYSTSLLEKVLKVIRDLKRVVNQDLLLQKLHDSKQCSVLLEPENDELDEYMEFDHHSISYDSRMDPDSEHNLDIPYDDIQYEPGSFSCDIVWETKFNLHSRLRTGQFSGKSLVSRGIQILQNHLFAFEVLNRKNMFVYRDTPGNVFYLRLFRMQEKLEPKEVEMKKHEGLELPLHSRSRSGSQCSGKDFPMIDLTAHGDKTVDDVILLQVHGITEAGSEIKEEIVQSLRNKLDDSVLEILSITLERTPHCKLTPEDVTFIQRPNTSPDITLKYAINDYAAGYLSAFAYYLHQNLLQVFYVPKYSDPKPEAHFQDIREGQINQGEKTIYLYNQSPVSALGGAGNRALACATVSIVNSKMEYISTADWIIPSTDALLQPFDETEFTSRVFTEEIVNDLASYKFFVELKMWRQGRVNLELLKNYFSTAMKHAIWDLTMEFYFLTAPLATDGSITDINSPKSMPGIGGLNLANEFDTSSSKNRRNSIVVLQQLLQNPKSEVDSRVRSMSFNAQKTTRSETKSLGGRTNATFPANTPILVKSRRTVDPELAGLNKFEIGDAGHLHSHYDKLMQEWCEYGEKLSVASIRKCHLKLLGHYCLEYVIEEIEKLIRQFVKPEYEPKIFWKCNPECGKFAANAVRSSCNGDVKTKIKKLNSSFEIYQKRMALSNSGKRTQIPDILQLFQEEEIFTPKLSEDECYIMGRNPVAWKASLGKVDPQHFQQEPRTLWKFSPLLSWGLENATHSSSSTSLEKMSRVNSGNGLAYLVSEPEQNNLPILIPRQRILIVKASNTKVNFIFYNWSKEATDRLVESSKILCLWVNARMSILNSIFAQKSGLFNNQVIVRSGLDYDSPFSGGNVEAEILLRNANPPREYAAIRMPTNVKKVKPSKSLEAFLEVFRNVKHHAVILKIPDTTASSIKVAEDQYLNLKLSIKNNEPKLNLGQHFLSSRNTSGGFTIIASDAIQAFKQTGRTFHYVLTPILFLPRWRTEVNATRDNSIGIIKKTRFIPDLKRPGLDMKSRHDSGTSQKSFESTKTKRSSIFGSLWQGSSSQLSQEIQSSSSSQSLNTLAKKPDEKWHSTLCESYIQEYMTYLQSLGFYPIHSRNLTKKLPSSRPDSGDLERQRHVSGTSLISTSSSQSGSSLGLTYGKRFREDSGGEKVHHLQKNFPGGVMLFELGLCEPFFYTKIYGLEITRMDPNKKEASGEFQEHVLEFLGECEKVKILMHLHSFTYDFHLRTIHSYICGRQLLFKNGYHIINFLDDFINYYPKGPSFARNTVHNGTIVVQNVSTPSQILYNYILGNEKLYNMKVVQMNLMNLEKNAESTMEYILAHLSSKKIVYKDVDDEKQCDEFDLTLLIAHDSPPFVHPYSADPSVLKLKYFIILTSRRELYPKLIDEQPDGKLCIVNQAAEPVSVQRELTTVVGVPENRMLRTRKVSTDERINALNDFYEQGMEKDKKNVQKSEVPPNEFYPAIKEEPVCYMGYVTSHEEMMQNIVKEQVVWVEGMIRGIVSQASVDCRRDLLWQRLLVGDDKQKNKKEDLISRETVGALSYWEFTELLELIHLQSLSQLDPRLRCLLRQPASFYKTLVRLITQGSQHHHRYFVSPDNLAYQVAIFSPHVHSSVVMLEINLEKQTADLSVLFKTADAKNNEGSKIPTLEHEILNLIEAVVNMCCYCQYASFLFDSH